MSAMRLNILAGAYALWILGIFVVFYLAHGADNNALQIAVICGVIPAGCQILVLGVDWRGLVAPVKIWLALILVILLSYFVNALNPLTALGGGAGTAIPVAWTPIVYTLNVVLILVIATLVAGCPDRRLLRSIASIYCILGGLFLLYVDLTGEMLWGRLRANDIESNVWGLVGLTVCLGAFARKPGPVAVAGFAAGGATILLANSREHMVALAVALLVIIALYLRDMNRSRLWAVLAGSCVTLILAALLLDPYILDAISYVNSDVLMLDSPNRGLNSGFTGRSDIWAATFDLWLKSPLLGIGFRQHEQFLPGALPAHNAYLAMLADTGLLGFIVYVVLQIGSLIASWGIQDQRTRRFVMTVILTYIVIGFFDRRTINAGNPFGLFFVMCCSVALVDQSLRKAAQHWRKPADGRAASWRPDPRAPAR
jgi:O-antigen ligase